MHSDLTQQGNGWGGAKPLVSVIVVVKNGARYLASALRSVFGQDYSPFEVLVVDGQSTDDTAQIAKSWGNIRYIWQSDHGLANARNIGIQAAQGDLIAFLDYDDLWASDKLSIQVGYLENHPEILYTITYVRFLLEQNHFLRPGFKRESFETGQVGCTPSALVARRVVFERIGGFNPDFVIGCDADWFARARDNAMAMSVIPRVLLYKRIHNANLSANARTNKQELLTVIRQSIERKRQRMINK
ncbi:MAG: glycosyltransferase [Chloroflexi bacterium]|nr:glycosyltransferase [Chloroflexota bacterium]